MNCQHHLSCAQGYLMLDMVEDALAELEVLPAEARMQPEAVELLVAVLMRRQDWRAAIALLDQMNLSGQGTDSQWINGAICLHKLGRTEEALERHNRCGDEAQQSSIFHYNLACYQAQLGCVQEALHNLRHAFALNPACRMNAQDDPDLVVLRGMADAL